MESASKRTATAIGAVTSVTALDLWQSSSSLTTSLNETLSTSRTVSCSPSPSSSQEEEDRHHHQQQQGRKNHVNNACHTAAAAPPHIMSLSSILIHRDGSMAPVTSCPWFCSLVPNTTDFNPNTTTRIKNNNDCSITTNKTSLYCQQENSLQLEEGITELAGVAGSGKSQIGLNICLDYCRQGDRNGALLISMGPKNHISHWVQRLNQMQTQRQQEQKQKQTISCPLKRILMRHVGNQDDFHELIHVTLGNLLSSRNNNNNNNNHIGVVILDDIASLFRTRESSSPFVGNNDNNASSFYYAQRSCQLFDAASRLKYLSETFHVAIVVMNQVTANIPAGQQQQQTPSLFSNPYNDNIPALGLSWSCCINTSYLVDKCSSSQYRNAVASGNVKLQPTRVLYRRFSSRHPPKSYYFCIQRRGPVLFCQSCRE